MGDGLLCEIEFDKTVLVNTGDGTPFIQISINGEQRNISLSSVSEDTLLFAYKTIPSDVPLKTLSFDSPVEIRLSGGIMEWTNNNLPLVKK